MSRTFKGCGILVDYFVLDDHKLKELSLVPFEEFLLGGKWAIQKRASE